MPLHELKAELAKVLFLACFSRIGMPLNEFRTKTSLYQCKEQL